MVSSLISTSRAILPGRSASRADQESTHLRVDLVPTPRQASGQSSNSNYRSDAASTGPLPMRHDSRDSLSISFAQVGIAHDRRADGGI